MIDPSLRAGRVASWSKQVGDDIAFGDEICIVALDDFVAIRRTARATLLAGRRRMKLKSGVEARSGKVLLTVAIRSSDTGVLRKIIKDQGDTVAIGDTMAIVTTQDGDDLGREGDWASAPAMRVVANPIDGDQDLEGGD